MEARRLSDWLGTADSLLKITLTTLGSLVALLAAVTGQLTPVFDTLGLPSGTAKPILLIVLIVTLGLFFWLDFRRFNRQSRLEQPDKFTLVATTPETLLGRDEDLLNLVRSVTQYRIVLLDGESGCGKSALVAAGLVPKLRAVDGLMPVLVRDWGDEWIRGPLAAALDALYAELTPEQRAKLGWTSPPDLAGKPSVLAATLGDRLGGVAEILARRPLLIADQFDDYQAQHREFMLDADGNWLAPGALARSNPFWRIVNQGLRNARLHLLAVTRADTASGLACLRFVDDALIATRPLPRVEEEYVRPLLAGLAPDDAKPPVVSHPENGWTALRELLDRDFRARGAALMQQVRTVLLGLRQLSVLTPAAYRRVGGMQGVETLVVERALRRAAAAMGEVEPGLIVARHVLGALVLPGAADQPPKARRRPMADLIAISGSRDRAERLLKSLQKDEIVRPAGLETTDVAWQLDHDYLARPVLAEQRQADRWGAALRDGYDRFRDRTGGVRATWSTLLPIPIQLGLAWEKLRGRLRYGDAAPYARFSAVKPLAALGMCALAVWGLLAFVEAESLRNRAQSLANRFGAGDVLAVLEAWRAPAPLRQRLFALEAADADALYSATMVKWPAAHAGVDPAQISQVTSLLRTALDQASEDRVFVLATAYVAVAQKLQDPKDIKAAAEALRAKLEEAPNDYLASGFASAYAAVAPKLQDPKDIKAAAEALRAKLEGAPNDFRASALATAYAAVAPKLQDPKDIKAAAEALRARLEGTPADSLAPAIATAYAAVAQKLQDPKDIKAATEALRARLEGTPADSLAPAPAIATAYAAVAQKLQDPKDIKAATEALRAKLETAPDFRAPDFSTAYAAVAQKLQDPEDIKADAEALRTKLEAAPNDLRASALATAYAAVAQKLQDPKDIKADAEVLRTKLEAAPNDLRASALATAYAAVAQKLQDPKDIKAAAEALRTKLEAAPDDFVVSDLATAYAAIAQKLQDPKDVKADAEALRTKLEAAPNDGRDFALATAYAAVAQKLQDPEDIKADAEALRTKLEAAPNDLRASALATAYAAVAQKLQDPKIIKADAEAVRARLEAAPTYRLASALATAYAALVASWLERHPGDPRREREAARALLAMAGHPFLGDPTALLAPVGSLAHRKFGNEIGAAVAWWVGHYSADPTPLRPPLPSLE